MRFSIQARLTCLILSSLPLFVHAQDIKPLRCDIDLSFPALSSLRLFQVQGSKDERVYFHKQDAGCPADSDHCRKTAYVLTGDSLLVHSIHGAWACATFQGARKETTGWVKKDRLQQDTSPLPRVQDWSGTWQDPVSDNEVKVVPQKNGLLRVTGTATYGTGASINIGELDGSMRPSGRAAELKDGSDEYACIARFLRVGRYLVVADNGNCGGHNVRFDGVYLQKNSKNP